jgi:hypothetical protein
MIGSARKSTLILTFTVMTVATGAHRPASDVTPKIGIAAPIRLCVAPPRARSSRSAAKWGVAPRSSPWSNAPPGPPWGSSVPWPQNRRLVRTVCSVLRADRPFGGLDRATISPRLGGRCAGAVPAEYSAGRCRLLIRLRASKARHSSRRRPAWRRLRSSRKPHWWCFSAITAVRC